MSGTVTVSIELPQKRTQALGRYKPKGTVNVSAGSSSRSYRVPVAVARHLKKLQDKDGLHVTSLGDFKELLDATYGQCAWNRILSLIERRDYSSSEALEKLSLDGYPDAVAAAAVSRAQDVHLIDDERYGEFFVYAKVNAGWGRARIQRELEQRGIAAESIPGWPDEFFSDEQDYGRAYALASRKHLTGKNDFQKIMRLLASKGYSSQIAYRVAKELVENE